MWRGRQTGDDAQACLAGWLKCCASAAVLALLVSEPVRAADLDLDDTDGLNTTTIAKRERDLEWLNTKEFGAETVAGQNRGFNKPDPWRVGNYIIAPEIGAAIVYDDNLYGSDAEKVGDFKAVIAPEVKFQSQLPRHVLDFSLSGKIVDYAEQNAQDHANAKARVDGALHLDHAHTLSAGALTELTNLERSSPETPVSAIEPVQVFHNRAATGITRDVGRLYGTISVAAESWDFQDSVAIDGRHLDLDPRDTHQFSTQMRVGYRISPGFEAIGKVRGLKTENKGDTAGDLDALGYEMLAGLAFETSPLLRWRILGGFGVRDYEQQGLENLTTSLLEAEVQWLPTQRLTIYGTLARRLNEVGGPDGSALLQTGIEIKADYEIYHNLLLNAGLLVREDNSVTTGITEFVYGGRIGLEYYLNKNWLFTFAYEHDVRESDSDSRDMHRNRFLIGAKLRF